LASKAIRRGFAGIGFPEWFFSFAGKAGTTNNPAKSFDLPLANAEKQHKIHA